MNEEDNYRKLGNELIEDIMEVTNRRKYDAIGLNRKFSALISCTLAMAIRDKMAPEKLEEYFDYFYTKYDKDFKVSS